MTNEARSLAEVKAWLKNPPQTYFLYVKRNPSPHPKLKMLRGTAATWMGDNLGRVYFYPSFKSNFGDLRANIVVYGTNGRVYYGTAFESAGDYARIKAYKDQEKIK